MQSHPPDKNNPSNPLVKVAALTIDKEYVQFAPKSAARVIVTLNFKRSGDLRGRAKTLEGESATVTFSLGVRRASLELTFAFEKNPTEVVKMERVAYVSTVHSKNQISDLVVAEKNTMKAIAGSIGGSVRAGPAGADGSVHASGKVEAGSREKTTRKRKETRTVSRSNVSATVGGNIVHWEIVPNMSNDSDRDGEGWLDGEVFKASNGKSIDACIAIWEPDEQRGLPIITASVFVSMADLIVSDVKVLSDLGEEISIKRFDTPENVVARYNPFQQDRVRECFVKQVIRKHLVSQGMSVEGARVQISKAST